MPRGEGRLGKPGVVSFYFKVDLHCLCWKNAEYANNCSKQCVSL